MLCSSEKLKRMTK